MSSQVSVQLYHLVLFVLVVFSFNVIILGYLTGAFSFGSMTQLTSSIISKISVRKVQAIPPWERHEDTAGEKGIPNLSNILSPGKIRALGGVPPSDCTAGLWKEATSSTVFCKTATGLWVESKGPKRVSELHEIWLRPEIKEAALYDPNRNRAVVLKKSVSFEGYGNTAKEALRVVFDQVYLKGGAFLNLQSSEQRKAAAENPEHQRGDSDDNDDSDEEDEEEVDEEAEDNTPHELTVKNVDPQKDCTHFWSKSKEAAFCRLSSGTWVELDAEEGSSKVRFEFKELYHYPEKGEAGLFDRSRLIVVCLLRRYGLIGHPESASQAMDVAKETDSVFFVGGQWRSDAPIRPIPPRVAPDAADSSKVVVLVSSYRDVLCSNTLKELFANAYNPDRVHAAVVNQANIGDIDCLDGYCKDVGEAKCRRNQVSQIRLPMDKSRGVMFARFLQQTLIQDEEFCLQVDSHMVFPTNWDRIAIQDWLGANNEMAVMTTYPNRAVDRNDDRHSPVRCNTVWGSNVVACGTSAHNIQHKQKMPHLTAFFGAGIAFSKCHANLVVPYDPYMAFLFKGEEYNRSARLWTHGYDLYAPKRNYAYHFYDEDPRPDKYKNIPRDRSFFGSTTDSTLLLKQSEYRWQAIMGMIPPQSPVSSSGDQDRFEKLKQAHAKSAALKSALLADVELFGLGNKRSLREYQIFSGINLAKHTNKDLCDQIGKMPWVPWNNTRYSILGRDCPSDASRECCKTALDKAMERGSFLNKYIGFTNAEWTSFVKKSETLPKNMTSVLSAPILEKGWSLAEKMC